MTVIEMHREFLLKTKSLDREDIKDVLSYDALSLLNQAQDLVIDELAANKNWGLLRPIIESISTASASFDVTYVDGIEGAAVIDLAALSPSVMAYRNYVRSQSTMTRTFVPTVTPAVDVQNEEIPKEILGDFETNGSNYPIYTNPKCFLEGDYLVVIPDFYTTLTHIITVIVRTPKALDLTTADATNVTTCELPTHLHKVIVDKAVQLFGENINVNDLNRQ